jgi:hypothetical protein
MEKQEAKGPPPPTGRQGGTEKKTNKHVSSTGREALTGMSVESERERERERDV